MPQVDGRAEVTDRKWNHVARMAIRWGDMDALGHVNNIVYFQYFEQARVEWLLSTGFAPEGTQDEGPVIVNTHCNFVRQLRYPGDIEVRTAVERIGRSSIDTIQQIVRLDAPDVVCAEGGTRIVWANYREERSVPVPEVLRALLGTA